MEPAPVATEDGEIGQGGEGGDWRTTGEPTIPKEE
jgi:hypothetical protein